MRKEPKLQSFDLPKVRHVQLRRGIVLQAYLSFKLKCTNFYWWAVSRARFKK